MIPETGNIGGFSMCLSLYLLARSSEKRKSGIWEGDTVSSRADRLSFWVPELRGCHQDFVRPEH